MVTRPEPTGNGWRGKVGAGKGSRSYQPVQANPTTTHTGSWEKVLGGEKGLKQHWSGTAPSRQAGLQMKTLGRCSVKWKCSHKCHILLLPPTQFLNKLNMGDEAFSS